MARVAAAVSVAVPSAANQTSEFWLRSCKLPPFAQASAASVSARIACWDFTRANALADPRPELPQDASPARGSFASVSVSVSAAGSLDSIRSPSLVMPSKVQPDWLDPRLAAAGKMPEGTYT
jgi:hypothetical protein